MGYENDTNFEEMAKAPTYQTEKKKYVIKNWYFHTTTYIAHQTMVPVKVETIDQGLVEAKPGDWLIEDDKDPGRTISVIQNAAFKAIFVETEKS